MKKRIFAIALVVGVMLSVCGSAWAAAEIKVYQLSTFGAEYLNLNNAKSRAGLSFTVRIRAKIQPDVETDGYQANRVFFEVTDATHNIVSKDSLKITPTSVDTTGEAFVATAELSGTLLPEATLKTLGDSVTDEVTLKATLYKNSSATDTTPSNTSSASAKTLDTTVTFGTSTADDVRNTVANFPTISNDSIFYASDVFEATDSMKSDPDSEFWDGIDPKYPSNATALKAQEALTADKGAKPKLGKIDKNKLNFKADETGTLTIPITGGCPVVDVYIAAKDANKLWPASVDKSGDPIKLTKANIKKFNIPFRITGENITTATGKTASSTLTLAFNGANVAYKGYPITIEMTNSLTSKPVAKAIKINVTPNTNVPGIYRYEPTETTITGLSYDIEQGALVGYAASNDKDNIVRFAEDTQLDNATARGADGSYDVYLNEKAIESYYYDEDIGEGTYSFKFAKITSGEVSFDVAKGYWVVSADKTDNNTTAHVYYDMSYTAPALKLYDKKAKPKQVWDISVPLTGSGDVSETNSPRVFYVSGDAIAPYIVTTKGEGKNGVSVDIQQPVYDKYGNVKTPGTVTIGGTLENLDKETKTGITITATNPSTKKKGSVKINVICKVPAKIDKSKFGDAPASKITDDMDADEKTYYSDYYKLMPTKTGAAGKVPSATFKAKYGSKTIYYEVTEGLDGLKAAGLSLDVKKGKLIALTTKDKVVPTVDEDGNYSPVELIVHAYNDIDYEGSDSYAYAVIGVTGAKPSVADKNVEFKTADYVNGTIKTFKLNAGKHKPLKATDTDANVKVRLAESSASALSDLGLALIDWTSIDCVVSKEATITPEDTITDKTEGATTYKLVSADGTVLTSAYVRDGKVVSVDEATVYYGSETVSGDESYRNFGAIIVKDKSKMQATDKLKVNLVLDNIGAAGKGAVTLKIGAAPTTSSSNSALPYSTVKVDANATAKKTNGTAGSYIPNNGSAPDADAEAESEAEGTVTIGAPRTVADLTAGQQAFLAEKGYTVVAVLPEITADAAGQYDFNVELDEEAPEGAKLIWVAFPKNAPASEDDEIVDFYDEVGTPVEGVPASHKIIASPWLREAVTYEPVIAIEAK